MVAGYLGRRAGSLALLFVGPLACGSHGSSYALDVGGDDAGSLDLGDAVAGTSGPLDAQIQQNHVDVKVVRVGCVGRCATVQAVATGGNPPYAYVWEDGSTDPTRVLCPSADASYLVTVNDTAKGGELGRASQTARASVTADVTSCPDAGVAWDGGVCAPGTYAGTFTGTGVVDASTTTQPGGPVSVPVMLSLADGGDGGADLICAAPVTINWDIAADWTPTFAGGLDCATGQFRAEDPMTPETVAGVPAGTCDMTWIGTLDPSSAALSGTWTADCSGVVWGGTWTVSLE
jgi:hypothetical protein